MRNFSSLSIHNPFLSLSAIPDELPWRAFNSSQPWDHSPTIPLLQFLSTVQAMLCSAFTLVTADVLSNLPELRLIVTTSVSVNHIDLPECHRCGIQIANAPRIFSEDVADLAVGLLIDVLRRISGANRFVRAGLWLRERDYPLGSKLWIPYCPMAEEVPKTRMAEAYTVLRDLKLPVNGYATDIGLVEYSPVREIFSFVLGNTVES